MEKRLAKYNLLELVQTTSVLTLLVAKGSTKLQFSSYEGGLLGYRHKSFSGTRSPFSPAPASVKSASSARAPVTLEERKVGAFKKRYVRFHRFNGNHVSLRDVGFCRDFQCVETAVSSSTVTLAAHARRGLIIIIAMYVALKRSRSILGLRGRNRSRPFFSVHTRFFISESVDTL